MEALKRQRAVLRGQVTRIATFCESTNPPLDQCKLRQTRLEQHMNEFERLQNDIEALIEDDGELAEEEEYRSEFENKFYELHARLSSMQNESDTRPENDSELSKTLKSLAENQTSLSDIVRTLKNPPRSSITISKPELPSRLPEIRLPEFSGKLDEWIRFRDLFTALVVSKTTLTGVEKLEYLQTRLKGDALAVVKHIPLSNDNFLIAWDLVKSHFDKPQFIMVTYLDNLFDQPAIKNGTLSEIKRLFTITTENINALSALKLPVNVWDTLLIYLLSKKLDSENKVLWIRKIKDIPQTAFSDFTDFLSERINELESLHLSRGNRPSVSSASKNGSRDCERRVFSATIPLCFKCSQRHFLYQCPEFRDLAVSSRCDFVKGNQICHNCLRAKHSSNVCKFSNCKKCGLKHNTMLHIDPNPSIPGNASSSKINTRGLAINAAQLKREWFTMLPTAIVKIKGINGNYKPCRALLDSGSQATLISEACIQRLGVRRTHASIPIVGLGQTNSSNGTRGKAELEISPITNSNRILSVSAFILSTLTNEVPNVEVNSANLSYFSHLSLADPKCHQPNRIDILIGADIVFDTLAEGLIVHPSGSPVAQNTIFGWVIAGKVFTNVEPTLNIFHSTVDLDVLLKQFFEHEDGKEANPNNCKVNEIIENHFVTTYFINSEGKYVVSLPFNKTVVEFGDSRSAALNLLHAMERRFTKNPELSYEYIEFMREYERLGHMTLVAQHELNRASFYLPHHAVLKPNSVTTKLRVVFNASSKSTNGLSLNDCLLVGPTIQNDLFTCTIKFRKHKIAVKADIAKMYRQILVNADDIHFQRILWRENVHEEPRDYVLLTVTYGTASASFLATRVLKQIGINNIAKYPRASDSLINDFYVDDYTTTFESVEEAISIKNDLCHILKEAGMDLRKWSSNSSEFLNTIDYDHREMVTELPIGAAGVRTLGLLWDTQTDCFKFSSTVPTIGLHVTKREVLSNIARIFDPLGWLSPVVIKMKIFIKRLWVKGIGWDEYIPMNFYQEWSDFNSDLSSLHTLSIPRWLQLGGREVVELHGFADASESAYSAAVYSRVVGIRGVHTTLICAKTRVSPVKPILSIPRVELCGSLLLAKLLSKVKDALCIHDIECFAYTDSTTVLHWIQGYPRPRNIFVDNRVSQIIALFPATIWHYVRSAENPADCATRGFMPKCLAEMDLWWKGPPFLQSTSIKFNDFPVTKLVPKAEDELVCLANSCSEKWDIFSRFSKLIRLLRVTARCIRLFRRHKSPSDQFRLYFLSPLDIRNAMIALVRLSQQDSFSDEIAQLTQGKSLSNNSKFIMLSPFIDQEGVFRVGGRLDNAEIPFEQKHPIILHRAHRLTQLIVEDCHSMNLHAGIRQMTYLLSLQYFVHGIHHIIKRCVHQCTSCIRQRGIPFQQQMASLPKQRLEPGVTFGNTGVDYAGPFTVRSWSGRGAKRYKAYVALFVCLATKALHLELVSDLSSTAFIAALRRFVARRGKCHTMYSDNGTNFVGANQQLRKWSNLFRSTQFQDQVSQELTTIGITWCFIPPNAPHFGGIWEAGVKTIKFHLRRVLSEASLTFEEFSTLLCQIEACANSRPLCTRFEGDMNPLTPAHFLIGRPLATVPDASDFSKRTSTLTRWQYIQRLLQGFWQKWSQDYITQLRKRPKWLKKQINVKINDIVLIKDDNQPPLKWPLGKITETHPGRDGLIRVVTVLTEKGEYKRPICKLCPLLPDDG